jgi:elongation factor G
LEPVSSLRITTPESHLGAALGEVSARRGVIRNVSSSLGASVIDASMPVARSFGFVTSLRSRTEGRGAVSMTFAGFEPVR